MSSADDKFWPRLLQKVAEGQVVPVIGRDLLVVETAAGPRLFHQLVAERLAAELNVPEEKLPSDYDANDVVCAYEGFHGDHAIINDEIVTIFTNLKVEMPEPLKMLADIAPFRLFVSTTCDTLLEQALAEARHQPPALVACPPANSHLDFDEALLQRHGSLVFQILGRVSGSTEFAVTEGQVLERMHDFMAGPHHPKKLIERLCASHLLILGVSFPDWLARFLLRLARTKPLWDSRRLTEVIAENGRGQQDLALFLRNFSPNQSSLFTGGSPVDFVRELHSRWSQFPSPPPPALATGEEPAKMANGSIFISYATEDRDAAFQLADEMAAEGLEAWVDRRLQPGDDYRNIIESYIGECCAFVPVLSRHTQVERKRWFRREWQQACDRKKDYFGTSLDFLFPVAVDETPMGELIEIRRSTFGTTSATPAPGGHAPPQLIRKLDDAQKAWRKQFARA
jgi:hypothetical protein